MMKLAEAEGWLCTFEPCLEHATEGIPQGAPQLDRIIARAGPVVAEYV
jgi:hypothetical protein